MTKRHADRRRRYRITLGHALAAVLSTSAGAAAVFGGVVMLAAGHSIRPQADNCGLITCSASVPTTPGRPALTTRTSRPHHAGVVRHKGDVPHRPSPRATSPSPTPPARTHHHPTPSPTPSAPAVTVGYSLVQQWNGGFRGEFTIVNHGTSAVSGWVLAAVFPGDHIASVSGENYQTRGSTLTLTPASSQPSIPPGGSQSAFFTATGPHQEPANCTFNGKACG